jgi:hypothetical protein
MLQEGEEARRANRIIQHVRQRILARHRVTQALVSLH